MIENCHTRPEKQESPNPVLFQPRAGSFREAEQAWKCGDYERTIEILTQASRQQPGNPKLLLNLGEAYGLRFDYAQAERCLEQAVAVASNKAEVLTEAGRRCQRFEQPQLAGRFFRRAADHPNVSPWVLGALAEFEESCSRFAEARAYADRALQLEPGYPGALLAQARLHRRSGEFEESERLLRALLLVTTGEISTRGWYELGTNLDRQGRYDEAMGAFLQAKAQLRAASAPYLAELDQVRAEARKDEQTISAATFQRWLAQASNLQPKRGFALLCGPPRSGTTLLEHALDAHGDIVAADETSILVGEVFPRLRDGAPENRPLVEVLEAASIEALQQARSDYFRLTEAFLGKAIGHRLLLDKNPALDVRIPVAVRIFPEASFLIAIRDPRDVCLSCFMLPLPPGRLSASYLTLEGTVAHYTWLMGLSRAIRAKLPCPQMEVRYEDVVADLEGSTRRVLAFLGLGWNEAVLRFNEHARTRVLRCGVDDGVTKPIFSSSVGRWRHYQKYLESYLKALDPFIKAFGYA